jgi:hypothetical protein
MSVPLWLSVGVAVLLVRVFIAKPQPKWLRYGAGAVAVALLIQPVIAGLHWLGGLVGA